MSFYKVQEEQIEMTNGKLSDVLEKLQEAYTKAQELKNKIDGEDWKGDARDVGSMYLDILLQYHATLSVNSGNSIEHSIKTFKELNQNGNKFYTDSDYFQKLESI